MTGAHAANAGPTFRAIGSTLLDPCGETLVVRGVNTGIAFPPDPTAKSLSEIAKTGANTVRLVFRWQINKSVPHSVDTALQKAVENHMVAMPSLWDATGDFSLLQFAVDFWAQPEMVEVLRKYEDMVLLNIANEAGQDVSAMEYRLGYQEAISKLRNAGLHMPLVIDAAGHGRDESYILENAKYLIANDPDHNLIFSWHPWDENQPHERYQTAIDSAVNNEIPLLLGEISHVGTDQRLPIDYPFLLEYTSEKGIGWLWWWWSSGQTPDIHAMTLDGTYGHWANVGKDVVAGPYGLQATSQRTRYLDSRACSANQNKVAAPPAPTHLTATAKQGAEVQLSWRDNSSTEKNFDIEVWDEVANHWRLLKVIGPSARRYRTVTTNIGAAAEFVYSLTAGLDPGLNYDTTYQIRVGAYRARDSIAYSAPVSVTTGSDPRLCSNGEGIQAEYFHADGFEGNWPGLYRTDPQINFDWGTGSPDPSDVSAPADHFVAVWSGDIEPQFDGEYTFYTNSDDFARVLIDGNLVVDNWRPFANGWAMGKTYLEAGTKHSITVEYMDWTGNANMALYWASNPLKRELVPQCRLFTPIYE